MDSKCLESFLIPEEIATEGFFFRNKNSSTNIKNLIKSEIKNNAVAKNYGANMLTILNDYSKNIALVIEPVNLGKIISLYNKLELIAKEFDDATHALYSSMNKENYAKCDKIVIKCNKEYKNFKSEYSKLNITETHECALAQSYIYKLNQMYNLISDIESKIDYRRDNLSDPSGKYDDDFDTYLDILQDCEACCSDMEVVLGIKGLLEKCKFSFK